MAEAKGATFGISIEGNAAQAGKDIAASAIDAARAMMRFDDETKTLSSELRRLRGNSDDVIAAKKQLKTRIEEVKASSSQLTVQLLKEGTTFTAAAHAAKKAEATKASAIVEAEARVAKAREEGAKIAKKYEDEKAAVVKKAADKNAEILKKSKDRGDKKAEKQRDAGGLGGTIAKAGEMRTRFKDLSAATGSKGGALKAMIGEAKLGTSALNAVGSMAGSAMAGVAAAGAAAALAIGAAVVGLISFALASSDAAAKAERQREALLGNATDAKAMGTQIQELAGKTALGTDELNSLSLSLAKTRLTGKAMVDTMNAVAQVTGAVDASAGAKLQEIITRGQNSGRMALGKRELQGTGIDFDDVAKQYAAGTKKSLAAARAELASGRAPLEAGAEAIRKATEAKFGKLNKKNAFSLAEGPKKIMQAFTALSSGVDLSPITDGLGKLFEELNPEAPLGSAVKWIIETLGNGFTSIAGEAIPAIIEGFKWMMVGALKLVSAFYVTKKAITDVFSKEGWAGVGRLLIDGLIEGLKMGVSALIDAVKWVGKTIKGAFTDELEIKSPSRVFAKYGTHSTQGYADGVTQSAPRAEAAVVSMAGRAKRGAAAGASQGGVAGAAMAGGGGMAPVFNFHVGSEAAANMLREPSTLAAITKSVRDAYITSGGASRAA